MMQKESNGYYQSNTMVVCKRICVVTSTRADFGILVPLIQRIQADEALELRLAVTGTHLSDAFGHTLDEIVSYGFTPDCEIPILADGNDGQAVSCTMAKALCGFADYFARCKPDLLVVLGDRYEMCAVCAAAVNARIPIAHLFGGETTEGAVDECYRHAITKMSYLHFAACETYRKRVIQLGEDPARVFNVGSLGVENALHTEKMSLKALERELQFDLSGKPYAVVTFHPVTLEAQTAQAQLREILAALMARSDISFIITKANADAGGAEINAVLDEYSQTASNCKLVDSLVMYKYMSALTYAAFVLGNSSSGLAEAPSFGIPTINIGDRQRGRLKAESVIDCPPERDAIIKAIEQAMRPAFRQVAKQAVNPYGSGNTSEQIMKIMIEFMQENKIDLKKKFYDIPFEVQE